MIGGNNEEDNKPSISDDYQTFDQESLTSYFYKYTESLITDDNKYIESYYCKNCRSFALFTEVYKEKMKIECKENIGSEISFEIIFNYLITTLKKEKIEKIAEKLNCRAHKKQFAYYCQNCKANLCENCNESHKCSKNSKDKKVVSFNELNRESEIKEAYIKEYLRKFKDKHYRDQENHTVLRKEEILFLPKIYNAVFFSKKNFPNYAHFFNIDKIYKYLLNNKIEIKYKKKMFPK